MQSTRWLLYTEQAPSAWFHFALCGLVGIMTAYAFVWISQYYTDYKYDPVRQVALSSTTGHGTNIIAGYLSSSSSELPYCCNLLVHESALCSWFYTEESIFKMDGCRNRPYR
jgi:Na+/H+-translocating membrane pyrophosphatase